MGASGSLLIATIVLEPFIPAMCWMAPEMPAAMYRCGAELVRQRLDLLEVALRAPSAGHHDAGLGELRAGALHLVEADELRLGRFDLGREGLHVAAATLLRRLELGCADGEALHRRRQ